MNERYCVLLIKDLFFFQIPILVIGTKVDMLEASRAHAQRRSATIAEECAADEIAVVSIMMMAKYNICVELLQFKDQFLSIFDHRIIQRCVLWRQAAVQLLNLADFLIR